jgi:hypothetical protein
LKVAPDLVVDVLAPSESASDLEEKISDYLTAGTRLIWIVDPEKRRVAIYSSGEPTRCLEADGLIDGDNVLPELTLATVIASKGWRRCWPEGVRPRHHRVATDQMMYAIQPARRRRSDAGR